MLNTNKTFFARGCPWAPRPAKGTTPWRAARVFHALLAPSIDEIQSSIASCDSAPGIALCRLRPPYYPNRRSVLESIADSGNYQPRGELAQQKIQINRVRSLQSASSDLAFSLDRRLTWMSANRKLRRRFVKVLAWSAA